MIRRNSSKIADSIVNSAHEEHFTVEKAIRDDAPITNSNAVALSINFESDLDGAYLLRKPLVKKQPLNKLSTDKQYLLYDNKTILKTVPYTPFAPFTIVGNPNAQFKLKYYDKNLQLKEKDITNDNITDWLSIKSSYNAIDYTLLSGYILTEEFKAHINDDLIYDYSDRPSQIRNLYRLIKIYLDTSIQATRYIVEIIHPEINTITSGLDVGNTSTLDINLLLDNPYAIRDLYGYGYVSTTKIVPYVIATDDSDYELSSIQNKPIWELTERTHSTGFKILTSANPTNFNKKFLILKAFLTTAQTNVNYYGCWEQSYDGGITWKECKEFTEQFQTETKLVSDISSAEFDNVVKTESLYQATSYLVEKKMVLLNLSTDYAVTDLIGSRPDVLIIPNPNFNTRYRFQIYIETDKETPTPEEKTETITKSSFTMALSDIFKQDIPIEYETSQGLASMGATVDNNQLVLHGSPAKYTGDSTSADRITPTDSTHSAPQNDAHLYPIQPRIGNSITIRSTNNNYKIKSISISLTATKSSTYVGGGLAAHATDISNYRCVTREYVGEGNIMVTESNPLNLDYKGRNKTAQYQWADDQVIAGNVVAKGVETSILADKTTQDANTNATFWVSPGGVYKYVPEDSSTITITNISEWLGYSLYTDSNYYPGQTVKDIKISQISVTYTTETVLPFTNTYLFSSTGTFQIPYGNNFNMVESLDKTRLGLFQGHFYVDERRAQLLVYNQNNLYISNTNSSIFKLMNSITFAEEITKVLSWRNYLLIFTPKTINLGMYNADTDTYDIKTLSTTTGVSSIDADTIVPILNSIYFKSGTRIYRLVPNLYAASDDTLNIHPVSTGINTFLEELNINYTETHNFGYTDSNVYMVFIPVNNNITYCIVYDFNKQLWNIHKYPVTLENIITVSNKEHYLYGNSTIYYFTESLNNLLKLGYGDIENPLPFEQYQQSIPYGDYLNATPIEILDTATTNQVSNYTGVFDSIRTPIEFEIDFGQKSSNYTVDKQFLESKMILATYYSKDSFPLEVEIETDGIGRTLHPDATTDSAIQKESLNDTNMLSTTFESDETNYSGILRQLIVKYSGRGKSIRHVVHGESKSLFKFYSLDVRGRILPKKR